MYSGEPLHSSLLHPSALWPPYSPTALLPCESLRQNKSSTGIHIHFLPHKLKLFYCWTLRGFQYVNAHDLRRYSRKRFSEIFAYFLTFQNRFPLLTGLVLKFERFRPAALVINPFLD